MHFRFVHVLTSCEVGQSFAQCNGISDLKTRPLSSSVGYIYVSKLLPISFSGNKYIFIQYKTHELAQM